MTTTPRFTADQAVDTLKAEGYPQGDVLAALDSLIDSGLALPQPDEGWIVLSADEMDVLRAQLGHPARSES